MVKHAFTLIELIISIVVISIIVGFYPILSTELNKTIDNAIEQNALFATTTRLTKILSAYWDETAYIYDPATFTFSAAQAVNVAAGGAAALNEVGTTSFRVGAFGADLERRFFRTDANATLSANFGFEADDNNTLGTGTNNPDDLDDFNMPANTFTSVYESGATAAAYSYKEDVNISIQVQYVSDVPVNDYNATNLVFDYNTTAVVGPTNIKMTSITTKRASGATLFTMRTYSSNIGEVKKYKEAIMP